MSSRLIQKFFAVELGEHGRVARTVFSNDSSGPAVSAPTYTPAASYELGVAGSVSPDEAPPAGASFALAPSSSPLPGGWSLDASTGAISTAAVTAASVLGGAGKGSLFGSYPSIVVRMTHDGTDYDSGPFTLKMVGNGLPATNLTGKWLAGVGITLDGSGNVQSWAHGAVKFDSATVAQRPALDADNALVFDHLLGTFLQSNVNFIGTLVGNEEKHTFGLLKIPTHSISGTNGIYGTNGGGYHAQYYGATALSAENYDGAADYASWGTAGGFPLFDEYMVVEQRHNPLDQLKLFVDGDLKAQVTSDVTSLPGPTNPLNLGCRDNDTQSGTFTMLAFLTYSRELTDNEQASVLSYLHDTFAAAL